RHHSNYKNHNQETRIHVPSRSSVSDMGFDPMDGCCPQKTRKEARVESLEGTQPRGFLRETDDTNAGRHSPTPAPIVIPSAAGVRQHFRNFVMSSASTFD